MGNKDIALKNAIKFFEGNELAATTYLNKYALKDKEGNYIEVDPLETIVRVMKALADSMPEEKTVDAFYDENGKATCKLSRPSEEWLKRVLKEEYDPEDSSRQYTWLEIFGKACNNFKGVVPGGSVLAAAGDYNKLQSLSNCFVVPQPSDTMSGIMRTNEMMAQIFKRRGGCIEESQRILIKDSGSVPIKDCEIGQEVLSFNIESGKAEYKKILNKFYTEVPKKDRLQVVFSNGTVLATSKKHPILVQNDKSSFYYKKAKSLHVGDINCKPILSSSKCDISYYNCKLEDIGWLIGCHLGDGTCGKFINCYERISKKDGRILKYKDEGLRLRIFGDNESVVKSYADIVNKVCKSRASYRISTKKCYKSVVWEYTCNTKSIVKFVDKYLDSQIGKKTYTAYTPSYIKRNNLWLPFLAGLIDSDGYVGKDGRVFLSITSKNLINDLSGMLTKCGVSFHVTIKKDKRNKKWKKLYKLNIHKNKHFYSLLYPLLKHDVKKKRLKDNITDKIFSRSFKLFKKDITIIEKAYEETKYSTNRYNKASVQETRNRTLLSANIGRIRNTSSVGIAALQHLLVNNIINQNHYNDISSRVFVKSISQDTTSEKYIDIVVEGNNNYFAGDFGFVCTHNCGTDLSTLRPDGSFVNNAAVNSSGAWGWASHFSNTCRDVAQRGRRGAQMLTLNIKHPDSEKWATMKEDLTYCTGANVSLWITDDFMKAVRNDSNFELKFPVNSDKPTYSKTIKAKDLWETICTSAWKMAEPGFLNWDVITKTLPAHSYKGYEVVSTNPCCFSEESNVSIITSNGIKDIKEVTGDDLVWVDSACKWAPTTGYFQSGKAEVFRVIFSNGEHVDITKNHKLERVTDKKVGTEIKFIKNSLVELRNLKIGDKISLSINKIKDELKDIVKNYNNSIQECHKDYTVIRSIEKIGIKQVGCINVPYYNKFSANGIVSGNSEIPLGFYDACRLISICLLGFVENAFSDSAMFNFNEFEKTVRIAVRMGEGLIGAENKHIGLIIEKIKKEQAGALDNKKIEYQLEIDLWENVLKKGQDGRRLGLGDHGWADMFSQLRVRYDSREAIKLAKKIKKLYRDTAYDESIEIAKEYGSFSIWDWEVEKNCDFFKTFPKELSDKMKSHGRRHISLLTNAPTGSISILGQCSSGIEPVFRNLYTRRRKINPNDTDSMIDFVDQNGDKWQEFPVFEKNIERYFKSIGKELPKDVKNDEGLSKLLPDYFVTSDKIDWKKRIEFQSVLTEYVDHSISSTINLPEDVSVETVKELYMYAWEKKLKGVTIYRDGSRSGVLVTNKQEELDHIVRSSAPKRPKKLPCEVHHTTVKGEPYVVIVGLLHATVYEVFFGKYANQIPKKNFSGYVERKNKGKYYLCFLDDELLELREININEYFDNTEYMSATRLLSMTLRHGGPLTYICDQLKKSSTNITEFGSAVSRVLKKYIKVEDLQEQYRTEYGDKFEVRMEDGCMKIINLETGEVETKCD